MDALKAFIDTHCPELTTKTHPRIPQKIAVALPENAYAIEQTLAFSTAEKNGPQGTDYLGSTKRVTIGMNNKN